MMPENVFIVVKRDKLEFLAETKTNYLLPIASPKAMCILLNYVLRNGDLPVTADTLHWWDNEDLQEYYQEDEWESKNG